MIIAFLELTFGVEEIKHSSEATELKSVHWLTQQLSVQSGFLS